MRSRRTSGSHILYSSRPVPLSIAKLFDIEQLLIYLLQRGKVLVPAVPSLDKMGRSDREFLSVCTQGFQRSCKCFTGAKVGVIPVILRDPLEQGAERFPQEIVEAAGAQAIMQSKTIAVMATVDTKAIEAQYLAEQIQQLGHQPVQKAVFSSGRSFIFSIDRLRSLLPRSNLENTVVEQPKKSVACLNMGDENRLSIEDPNLQLQFFPSKAVFLLTLDLCPRFNRNHGTCKVVYRRSSSRRTS